jgi:hypothetical protein
MTFHQVLTLTENPPGTFTRTCLNGGGYNQNIYGNSITIP